ncbi:hypothetical protein [Acinetobacter modestus]|uniref:hypothetical protein n=1 Tax=Acinetobacter modestus TaxID=1776740 RepID=UPI001F4AFF0C|nr:hypothetical protein [Acinetobacter modestus]MCH7329444.1 hypothetical protein [Acinetobacter modestus]
MLLNEQDFMKPMKLVYQVRVKIEQNPKHVKAVQALTLNQSRPTHGLNGTYGLYGSAEWLNNLELGVIPRKKITGLIRRIYIVDMDESEGPDTMDVVLDCDGKTVSKGIFFNDENDLQLFEVGKRVEILYYIEEMKAVDHSTGEKVKHEFVLEMAVSI